MLLLSLLLVLLSLLCPQAKGLVPLNRMEAMSGWVSTELSSRETFDGVVLRPRLRSLDSDPYMLGVMETQDVPGVARVIAESFSNLVVTSDDGATWESAVLDGVANIVTAYDVRLARCRCFRILVRTRISPRRTQVAEYSRGLRQRCGGRLARPLDLDVADDPGSLVVTVGRRDAVDVVGAVELTLRDADGTAPGPFIFLDKVRQSVFQRGGVMNRPYISNLCVSKKYRRRGIAGTLLSAAEYVASAVWGYDTVFLHVHENNKKALDLYRSAGYLEIALNDTIIPPAFHSPSLVYHAKPLLPIHHSLHAEGGGGPTVADIQNQIRGYYYGGARSELRRKITSM